MKPIATLAASCPPLLAGPLAATDAEDLAQALKVLADPARLRLLSLIQAQPTEEACVCHPVAAGLGGELKDSRLPVDDDAHVVAVDRRLCPCDGELLDSGRKRGGANRG